MQNSDYPGYIIRNQFDAEINKCQAAITENPNDAEALANLAHMYIVLWCYGFIPHAEAIPIAKDAVEKALEIDANNSTAHVSQALINESLWDWENVENELKLGLELAPDSALAHNWYANYLYATSRFDEAYATAEKAIELSPDPGYKIGLGAVSYFAQDFERLKKEMLAVIEVHPEYAPAYDWLGMAYIQLKDFDNSIDVYEKAATFSGRLGEILGGLGHAYGIAGNEAEARRVLNEMLSFDEKTYMPPVQIAFVYAGLNDDENTFRMLERAYSEKSWELIFARTEPWLEHLQDDVRMKNILSKMKFPPLG